MRKVIVMMSLLATIVLFASCERVAPNYAGVLIENFGKEGKNDFKVGRIFGTRNTEGCG